MHALGPMTAADLHWWRQTLHLSRRFFLAALLAFSALGTGCGGDSDCVVDGTCDDDEEEDATDALSLALRSVDLNSPASPAATEPAG